MEEKKDMKDIKNEDENLEDNYQEEEIEKTKENEGGKRERTNGTRR